MSLLDAGGDEQSTSNFVSILKYGKHVSFTDADGVSEERAGSLLMVPSYDGKCYVCANYTCS